MFCPNCGARNAEADTTCQKCGYNLKEAAGAKFKGTMLMMNNPAAAEARRSVPPTGGVAPGANPGPKPPPPAATSPTEAQQMRAKLKGTMIGVAPPAAALLNPQQPNPQQPAAPAARQPSAPPGYSQPGPGQVNAPGAAIHRGGGTMIGTGIGVVGPFPTPGSVRPPAQPAPSAHSPTELLPVSGQPAPAVPQSAPQGFAATYGVGVPNQASPAATVRSPADHHPLAQTQVAAGANESFPSGVVGGQVSANHPEPAATRAMSQFEQQQPQRPLNTLEGTMVAAGGIPTAPRTDSMPQVAPQFAAQAGRTDTPPMGMPAAGGQHSYTGPGYAAPDYASASTAAPSKSKTLLLTVLTCGLYRLFKKAQ